MYYTHIWSYDHDTGVTTGTPTGQDYMRHWTGPYQGFYGGFYTSFTGFGCWTSYDHALYPDMVI